MTVVSENGIIRIADSSGNYSVSVFSISTQSAEYQYRIVCNSTYQGQTNTTDIFLKSTNGYFNRITNFQGQVGGIFNVSVINATSSATIIAMYPIFATARIVYRQETDAPTPPPGGGLSGYYAENHAEEIFQGNQVDEIWLNFTLWFYYNSENQPVFVDAWWNMTAEASEVIYVYGTGGGTQKNYYDTDFQVWFAGWGGTIHSVFHNYSTSVGGDAGIWYYSVYNWYDTEYDPIGYNVWENDTIAYVDSVGAVLLETSVPVKNL